MKRSQAVELRILPAVAAAALAMGCGSPSNQRAVNPYDRYCMDQNKTLVELTKCEGERPRGGHPYVPLYAWVYGPRGAAWRPGTPIGGNPSFSRVPPSGMTIPGQSATTRGGFGSSARPTAS